MNQSEKITPQAWWTLVAVSLGTFMLLLDITIVIVALPDIQKALGAGFDDAQWTVDAYSLSLASLLLVGFASAQSETSSSKAPTPKGPATLQRQAGIDAPDFPPGIFTDGGHYSLADMKENSSAAFDLKPEKEADLPADQQADFQAKYQAGLKEFGATIDKAIASLKAGDNAAAAETVKSLGGLERKDHKQFKKPHPEDSK